MLRKVITLLPPNSGEESGWMDGNKGDFSLVTEDGGRTPKLTIGRKQFRLVGMSLNLRVGAMGDLADEGVQYAVRVRREGAAAICKYHTLSLLTPFGAAPA